MRCIVSIAATVMLLSACSSNQTSSISQQNNSGDSQHIQNAADSIQETNPQKDLPRIPLDGRLRDEHMRMYVSVKIKQEQIRFENAVTNVGVRELKSENNLDIASEKLAIENFEFSPELYFWSKQIINFTLKQAIEKGVDRPRRISSFEDAVFVHNLSMVEKFRDELRFVQNYKLHPSSLLEAQSVKAEQSYSDQRSALFPKPSS